MKIAVPVLLVLVAGIFFAAPPIAERFAQGVEDHGPYAIREEAASLHARLTVADLHSDSLLWHRDLLDRGSRGHVDFPRLREGNVALQVFGVPTRTPSSQNYDRNSRDTFDMIMLLAILQRWPAPAWTDLTERALYMADRLRGFEERAPDRVRVVATRSELDGLLAHRAAGGEGIGAVLAIEGGHALDGSIENVDVLYDADYRMVGLQHFFDNGLGGSLHGVEKLGLTTFGREVVAALEARKMIIDVAHSSAAVVEDVLAIAQRPVVVSHTGIRGVCDSARNLPDPLMKRIAEAGGLVGVGYWAGAVCDTTPAGVARSIAYAVELLGARHVALGSDYDGGTFTRFDTSELAALTQALLDEGLTEAQVAAVMGDNLIRFLRAQLP